MPNRKVPAGKQTKLRPVTGRHTVRQPATPLIRVSSEMDNAQLETFLRATDNRAYTDVNERINDIHSGGRSPELPYDVKRE